MLNLESVFNMSKLAVLESLFYTVALKPEMLAFPKEEYFEILALVQKIYSKNNQYKEVIEFSMRLQCRFYAYKIRKLSVRKNEIYSFGYKRLKKEPPFGVFNIYIEFG